jgi:hypothetical protein
MTETSTMPSKTGDNIDLLDFDWDTLDFSKPGTFSERKPETLPDQVKPEDDKRNTEILS